MEVVFLKCNFRDILFGTVMNLAAFSLFVAGVVPITEITLLIDLFKFQNVDYALNVHCSKALAGITAHRAFNHHQIRAASINPNASFEFAFSYRKIGLILNTSCENWYSVFDNLNVRSTFQSPFQWFIITQNLTETTKILSQYPVEIDSNVIVVYKAAERFYSLYEVYNTGFYTSGEFKVVSIGYWNSSLHARVSMRMNLTGVVLKAATVVTQNVVNETFEEFVERSRYSKSDTLHKHKYFTLLKYLRDFYKFSYDLRRTSSWGYLHNGSFDGMIGSLQREETDIGGSPIFYRLERAKVVDSTIEVWNSRPVFIMRHPKHPGGYFTIFTRPLTTRVWGCILLVLLLSSSILCTLLKLTWLKVEGDDEDSSASLAVLTIWSAICQQGSSVSRDSTSIKLVTFVTFVFAVTIYQYYNATVVSTLLHEPPKNIRTPSDLLRSNLKAGVHDVLYNRDFFKRTTDPIALEMYRKKIITPSGRNFYDLDHGISLVKNGGFAFLVDNSVAYGVMRGLFSEAELCEVHEVALYPPQNLVAVVKKGSPYREHFAYGLRLMFESGLMKRIKSAWDEPRPACVRTPDSSLITVSLREFATPLVALSVGIILATLVLLVEIVVCRFSEKFKKVAFLH